MATVSIPMLLHEVTHGARSAEVAGQTVAEVIAELDRLYPGIADRLRDRERILPTVALTVDGKIAAAGLDTPVGPESKVGILPSFGGG